MSKLSLSKSNFNTILTLMADDQVFRKRFFENPEIALNEKNITVDESDLAALKNIFFQKEQKVKPDFNEGLVLCSSSGY